MVVLVTITNNNSQGYFDSLYILSEYICNSPPAIWVGRLSIHRMASFDLYPCAMARLSCGTQSKAQSKTMAPFNSPTLTHDGVSSDSLQLTKIAMFLYKIKEKISWHSKINLPFLSAKVSGFFFYQFSLTPSAVCIEYQVEWLQVAVTPWHVYDRFQKIKLLLFYYHDV